MLSLRLSISSEGAGKEKTWLDSFSIQFLLVTSVLVCLEKT